MADMQRVGGVAAMTMAATFIVGFALYFAFLTGSGFDSEDPIEKVAFLAENQTILSVWHLIIYVLFGIALVALSIALYTQMQAKSPGIAEAATAFGLIWAGLVIASGMIAVVGMGNVADLHAADPVQAGSVWLAIESVQIGIGGGIEIVGGLWVLLIGWAAVRARELSRGLNYLAVVIGIAGILTIVQTLEAFGAVFGLGLIVWFIWVGIHMIRGSRAPGNAAVTTANIQDPEGQFRPGW